MSKILRSQTIDHQVVHDEHIVPRFYLNKFADKEKHLFVYEPGRSARRKSTKSQCSDKDYFEYTINGEATSNLYENWFQKIETAASRIYETMQAGIGHTRHQEEAWSLFIATLFLRSQKVREQIGPRLTEQVESELFHDDDQIREMQVELLKQGEFIYLEDLRAKVNQIKLEMRAPAFGHLAGIEQNAHMIAEDIFKRKWFVFKAAPGTAFITSDCPVQTYSLDLTGKSTNTTLGMGFGHPNTAVVLPLSPTHLFLAGPQEIGWKSDVLTETEMIVFNTSAARFGYRHVFARHRSSATQALVDNEINKVIYGQNAFVPSASIGTNVDTLHSKMAK